MGLRVKSSVEALRQRAEARKLGRRRCIRGLALDDCLSNSHADVSQDVDIISGWDICHILCSLDGPHDAQYGRKDCACGIICTQDDRGQQLAPYLGSRTALC